MSFGTPWALAGLLLAIPLALLHLRRRRPRVVEVPSLLPWSRPSAVVGASTRRLGKPVHLLLLVLQLLALTLFVVALARPHSASTPTSTRAFVVDDSIWMSTEEGGTTRLQTASAVLRQELGSLPGDHDVAVLLAGAEPKVLYEGSAAGAAGAVTKLPATFGPADLAGALRAAESLPLGGEPVELLRAPDDPPPATVGSPDGLRERTIGGRVDDQGLAEASARCLPGTNRCQVLARVVNADEAARTDAVTVLAAGTGVSSQSVRVPAGGSAPIAFRAPPGARLQLALAAGDALAADDRAFVEVPATEPVRITLVGEKKDAEPLARALIAIPGGTVTLRTPADFEPADARRADLLIVDGRAPRHPVPASVSALILVDPPRLPGGSHSGSLSRSRLSGTDPTAAILDGVDLNSLSIGRGGAGRLVLPPWLRAAAWAPGGPLLATGIHGGSREAVLAFDPADSNLPQLPSFPRLIDNLVAWSQEWAPAAVGAGEPFLAERPAGAGPTLVATASGRREAFTRAVLKLPRPGFYALRQRGAWGLRGRTTVANADLAAAPASAPVFLGRSPAVTSGGSDLRPWFLAAALLVLLVEAAVAYRLESVGPAFVVLRSAAVVLAVVALFDPHSGGDPPPTTVVVQRSPGLEQSAVASGRRWTEAAAACADRCRVLAAGTDLEATLRGAIGTTPHGGRVVVLANGRQARGEALATVAAARARGVSVDAAPLPEHGRDAALTRLTLPAAVHAGDPLSVAVNVRSSVAAPAKVSLYVDGKRRGTRAVRLAVGDNPYLLSQEAPGPGSHGYRVTVAMPGDERLGNDALTATVRVSRRPRALVVGGGESKLAAILHGDGIEVSSVAPAALPTSPTGLDRFDVVALDDVAAPELGAARAGALASAVREGRTGLLVVGGPHSFSLGGYYASPLQDALPVTSLKPGNLQRRNLSLEVVLDRSGSMSERVAGVEKIAMAKVATHSATAFVARHRDQLGAIAFDTTPHLVAPLARIDSTAKAAAVNRAINRIRAEGGTNIYKALAAGVDEIERSDERDRHVVLLSDGISEKGSYAALLPRLRAEHITVSTVALGLDADFELLDSIAKATGGHFYATDDPHELPKIFAKDARAAARPVRLHGKIAVTPGEDSPIVRDLAGARLPSLHGNVVTAVKPGAGAVLLGEDKDHPPDPTLAQWQYGGGRVVVWTPGLGDWAAAYAKLPVLFADAARWVEPGVAPTGLAPRVVPGEDGAVEVDEAEGPAPASGVGALEGSLVAPGGKPAPLRLTQRAPWRWTAPLPDRAPGIDAFALRRERATSRGLLAVPYSAALRPLPAEATPLGPLAAGAGGRILPAADTTVLEGDRHDLWWWFVIAALSCFVADVAVRLLPRRRGADRQGLRPRSGAGPNAGRRADPVGSAR